jgi:hypothetical protein
MEYEFLDVKMHEKLVETYLVIRLLEGDDPPYIGGEVSIPLKELKEKLDGL